MAIHCQRDQNKGNDQDDERTLNPSSLNAISIAVDIDATVFEMLGDDGDTSSVEGGVAR